MTDDTSLPYKLEIEERLFNIQYLKKSLKRYNQLTPNGYTLLIIYNSNMHLVWIHVCRTPLPQEVNVMFLMLLWWYYNLEPAFKIREKKILDFNFISFKFIFNHGSLYIFTLFFIRPWNNLQLKKITIIIKI